MDTTGFSCVDEKNLRGSALMDITVFPVWMKRICAGVL